MSLDIGLFRLINDLAGRSALFDSVARLFVNDYFVTTTLALLLLVLWFAPGAPARRRRHQRTFFETALSVFIANIVLKGINLLYFRPRPFMRLDVTLCFYKPSDSSWPSNPATFAFAFATAVYVKHHRIGAVMYGLATIFVLSRVYCGIHYPLDIVTGALLGSLTAAVVSRSSDCVNPIWDWLIGVGRRLYLA